MNESATASAGGEEIFAASAGRKSDANDISLGHQHRINRERAARDGLRIPEGPDFEFGDDDTSGKTRRRSDFDRLVRLVQSGTAPFRYVYFKDRSRLGRWKDPRLISYYEVLFEEHGVKIRYSGEERHVDFSEGMASSDVGHFVYTQMGTVQTATELTTTLWRTRGGLSTHFKDGYYVGARAPYGTVRWLVNSRTGEFVRALSRGELLRYKDHRFKLRWSEGDECKVIRLIFEEIAGGRSLNKVAELLSSKRYPAPSGAPRWSAEAVRRIARHPLYCGDYVRFRHREGSLTPVAEADTFLEGPTVYEDFIASPPITRELFNRVGEVLDGSRAHWSRRHATNPGYLISGTLACAHCGRILSGHTGRPSKDGRRVRYYRHLPPRGVSQEPCPFDHRYVDANAVEDAVCSTVLSVFRGEFEAEILAALELQAGVTGAEAMEEAIRELEARRSRKQAAVVRLVQENAEAPDELLRTSYEVALGNLRAEVAAIDRDLGAQRSEHARVVQLQKAGMRAKGTPSFGDLFERGDLAARKRMIEELVEIARLDLETGRLEVVTKLP